MEWNSVLSTMVSLPSPAGKRTGVSHLKRHWLEPRFSPSHAQPIRCGGGGEIRSTVVCPRSVVPSRRPHPRRDVAMRRPARSGLTAELGFRQTAMASDSLPKALDSALGGFGSAIPVMCSIYIQTAPDICQHSCSLHPCCRPVSERRCRSAEAGTVTARRSRRR